MNAIWIGLGLCLCICLAQIFLARILGARVHRIIPWCGVLISFSLTHFILEDAATFIRMIGLCTVLLAGMKWIVYREWVATPGKKRELSWCRWLMFSCAWFGMEPQYFAGNRRQCEWRNHVYRASGYIIVGGVLWYMMYRLKVDTLVLLFIPMSMVFHFGVLRLLVAFWRMLGFPVRVLFRNPLETRGFRDFWGARWNIAYSQMMARTVKQPLVPIIGEKWSMFMVFVVSGLLHEFAITLPVEAGYGLPTLFFIVQGVFTVLEKKETIYSAFACGVLLVVGLPYLFVEKFVIEVIIPCRDVFEMLELIII